MFCIQPLFSVTWVFENSMFCFPQDIPRFVFDRYESIELPLKIHFEQINLDPMLAAGVTPIEVRPGVALASVIGSLEVTNNRQDVIPSVL